MSIQLYSSDLGDEEWRVIAGDGAAPASAYRKTVPAAKLDGHAVTLALVKRYAAGAPT